MSRVHRLIFWFWNILRCWTKGPRAQHILCSIWWHDMSVKFIHLVVVRYPKSKKGENDEDVTLNIFIDKLSLISKAQLTVNPEIGSFSFPMLIIKEEKRSIMNKIFLLLMLRSNIMFRRIFLFFFYTLISLGNLPDNFYVDETWHWHFRLGRHLHSN